MRGTTAPAFREVRRSHAADDVFEQLAGAIVRGTMAPGTELPPERVLEERFGVSRVIARQAVHRLAELGLVRVRQGGATLVLDPNTATDLRVIEVFFRYGDYTARDEADLDARQLLQGHALLQLAEVRATREERREIAVIAKEYTKRGAPTDGLGAFERRFWTRVAEVGRNRVYILEVHWWFRLLDERPRARHREFGLPAARAMFFAELARRFAAGENAAGFYMERARAALHTLVPTQPSRP